MYGTFVLYKIPGALAHWRGVWADLRPGEGTLTSQPLGQYHHTVLSHHTQDIGKFSPCKLIFLTGRSGFVILIRLQMRNHTGLVDDASSDLIIVPFACYGGYS